MDFDFSDDQQQLREACARWVQRSYTFERRRATVAAGGFSRQTYAELADLGLCALYVPPEYDGLGLGAVEGMVVMEELGRGLVLEPLLHALLASRVIADHAAAPVCQRWLPALASGTALVALAVQERGLRYRWERTQAQATRVDGVWRISAQRHLVPAGDHAQAFLVPARIGDRLALFLVAADDPGVSVHGYATQDGSRAADLLCDGAGATLVTEDGDQALATAMDWGVAGVCAQAVGIMDQTLAVTVDYMNTRRQFGVPIASFQALRHRVADMKMQLELARSMSYYASLKLNAPAAERRQAIARAKTQLGQSMRFVGQQAVQLHGGIGVTDEYIVSHCFKALTQLEMSFGDSLHHLGQVSELMQDSAGVFS